MADIRLGHAFRSNFGLGTKYDPSLNSVYKTYIDSLEHDMIAAAYGINPNAGTITKTFDLNMTQQDIDDCVGEIRYAVLENVIIKFCKKHDVELTIERNSLNIVITVNMLNSFQVLYV